MTVCKCLCNISRYSVALLDSCQLDRRFRFLILPGHVFYYATISFALLVKGSRFRRLNHIRGRVCCLGSAINHRLATFAGLTGQRQEWSKRASDLDAKNTTLPKTSQHSRPQPPSETERPQRNKRDGFNCKSDHQDVLRTDSILKKLNPRVCLAAAELAC